MSPAARVLAPSALALAAGVLLAATARGEVQSREVTYRHDGVELKGYFAWDDARRGQRPGVVVVHEWWGRNAYAERRARELAGFGYAAFALDMYGGARATEDAEEAGERAGALYEDLELARARAAAGLETLRDQPEVDPTRVAAIGFCFGGTMALQMAYAGLDLSGVVSLHGNPRPPAADDAVSAPVLVLHGADDPHVEAETLAEFEAAMASRGVDWQLVKYGGAVHAFTNPAANRAGSAAYDPRAARRAWMDVRLFLGEVLGPRHEGLSPAGEARLRGLLDLAGPEFATRARELAASGEREDLLVLTHALLELPWVPELEPRGRGDRRMRLIGIEGLLDDLVAAPGHDGLRAACFRALAGGRGDADEAAEALLDWTLEADLVWSGRRWVPAE